MSYIIYADIEPLIQKIDGCTSNPENSSITKIGDHIPCGSSMSTIWAFDRIENKHNSYRGKDRMKLFCESLREHAKNITDFEKKKMLPLTKEELKSHQDANAYYKCGKRILKKLSKSINYRNVRDHCNYAGQYQDETHGICNLKFNGSNEILVVFDIGSNYDYHFIMKELANKFEGKFEYLGEHTEKYKTFFVPIEKEVTEVDNGGHESVTISYRIKFIDSTKFMATSLSNLADNLTEGIHKI